MGRNVFGAIVEGVAGLCLLYSKYRMSWKWVFFIICILTQKYVEGLKHGLDYSLNSHKEAWVRITEHCTLSRTMHHVELIGEFGNPGKRRKCL